MNSYIVKLIYKVDFEKSSRITQFDEQVVYIAAKNREEAYLKGKVHGKRHEEKFKGANNEDIEWKFIDIIDLIELEVSKSGESLYSITHEACDSNSFINLVKHKSQIIQTRLLSFQ